MTFPVLATFAQSVDTSDGLTMTPTMPSSIAAGDFLLYVLTIDRGNRPVASITAGWNEIIDSPVGSAAVRTYIYTKVAVVSEPAPVATFDDNNKGAMSVYRVTGSGNSAIISAIIQESDNTDVDFPDVGVTSDSLGLRVASWDDETATVTTPPTGTIVGILKQGGLVSQVTYQFNVGSGTTGTDTLVASGVNKNVGHTVVIGETPDTQITNITPDPVITDSSGTVVTGTGFEAVQSTGTVEQTIDGVTIEVSAYASWADTSLSVTSVDVEVDDDGTGKQLKYGSNTWTVTADGGGTNTFPRDVDPPTDNAFVNLTSLASSGLRVTAIPDLAVGNQLRNESFLQQGGSPTLFTVVVNDDATISVDGGTDEGSYTFEVRAFDDITETWGTAADQGVTIGEGGLITALMVSPMVTDLVQNLVRSN